MLLCLFLMFQGNQELEPKLRHKVFGVITATYLLQPGLSMSKDVTLVLLIKMCSLHHLDKPVPELQFTLTF